MLPHSSSTSVSPIPLAECVSISSRWIDVGDRRLDASNYANDTFAALEALENSPYPKRQLGSLCGTIWHPVQTQARTNFKRVYTRPEHGVPFVSSRNMFDLPLRPIRHLSRRMLKLPDLMVPERWLVVSRSGTVGNVLYVSETLASCAITDHAIRVEPVDVAPGYLYALLASSVGQALIERAVFGATVDELEPKHLAAIPVPIASQTDMDAIDALVVRAYELRDEANATLSVAESRLHSVLGVSPFTDDDVEYLGSPSDARGFTVPSTELAGRFDASNHLPLARSALKKLQGGNWRLAPLGGLCHEIRIPPRFKRSYVTQDLGVPYLVPSQLMAQRPYGLKALSERQARENPGYLLKEGEVLLTTDGTIGRVHPVTARMAGWFGSNNMARLSGEIDGGFLYAFLATPFGLHQVAKDTYGGVIDHINEEHIEQVMCPVVPPDVQREVGDLVRRGFALKDAANEQEDLALAKMCEIVDFRPMRPASLPGETTSY